MKVLVALWLCLLQLVCGEFVQNFDCPKVEVVQNVDLKKLAGLWHIIETDPHGHGSEYRCGNEVLEFKPDSRTMEGVFYYVDLNTSVAENWTYSITHNENTTAGDFTLRMAFDDEILVTPVKIVDTDYDNYVVYWYCDREEDTTYKLATVETRTKNPSEDVLKKAHDALDRNKLDRSKMFKVIQDCKN